MKILLASLWNQKRSSLPTYILLLFDVSLEDVLIFASGCTAIPPMEFTNRPWIEFIHQELPTTCTCGPSLVLPLKLDDEHTFIEKMCFGIKWIGQY